MKIGELTLVLRLGPLFGGFSLWMGFGLDAIRDSLEEWELGKRDGGGIKRGDDQDISLKDDALASCDLSGLYEEKILPVVKNQHLLLCTLLIGNALAVVLLDFLLGKRHSALLWQAELKTLVDMVGNEAGKGGELTHDETTTISGSLDMAKKIVKDAVSNEDLESFPNFYEVLGIITLEGIMDEPRQHVRPMLQVNWQKPTFGTYTVNLDGAFDCKNGAGLVLGTYTGRMEHMTDPFTVEAFSCLSSFGFCCRLRYHDLALIHILRWMGIMVADSVAKYGLCVSDVF
ncbi:hypothetical protein DITRI_Ditri04bG0171500 [Diplodiscus trichospermus]